MEVVYRVVLAGKVTCGEVWTPAPVSVAVTGQMVVYRAMVSVVTEPTFAGQLVTVGAHDVTV